MYFIYLMLTIRASAKLVVDGHGTEADHPLYVTRIGLPENLATIIFQLAIGLMLIVLGAKGFVLGVEELSPGQRAGVGAVAADRAGRDRVAGEDQLDPVDRRRRDTLAFGISPCMVFQGSLLPALASCSRPGAAPECCSAWDSRCLPAAICSSCCGAATAALASCDQRPVLSRLLLSSLVMASLNDGNGASPAISRSRSPVRWVHSRR